MSDKIDNNNMDMDEFDETIVFADENGNEIEFREVECFEHKGKTYSAITPVEPVEGWSEDGEEVIFCEVTEGEDDYETLEIVEDEALMDELIEVLNNLPDDEFDEDYKEEE